MVNELRKTIRMRQETPKSVNWRIPLIRRGSGLPISEALNSSANLLNHHSRFRFLYATDTPGFVSQKNGFGNRSAYEWWDRDSRFHQNDTLH
jgi:hypothetical protein